MAERTIRVMSYNIHHGRTLWEGGALRRIADVIHAERAEVIALQEVDRNYGRRSDGEDQADWLANRLGIEYAFCVHVDRAAAEGRPGRRQAGTAILSRHPILKAAAHPMQSLAGRTVPAGPDGLLGVTLDVDGVALRVATIHLDVFFSRQRQREAAEILDIIGGVAGPVVRTGDLNASPRSPEVRLLTDEGGFANVFETLGLPHAPSLPMVWPVRRIDYIFTRGAIRPVRAYVGRTPASDHLPVIADLMLTT